jgi:hypothetical protein
MGRLSARYGAELLVCHVVCVFATAVDGRVGAPGGRASKGALDNMIRHAGGARRVHSSRTPRIPETGLCAATH